MSYCRWSCDGFKSDVYCYAAVGGGYQIHVAAQRITTPVTEIDWSSPEALRESVGAQKADLDNAKHEHIGLKYDGQSFSLDDADECLQMMQHLRDTGYYVPDSAMQALAEDAGISGEDGG